jgi:hypothetical protein
MARPRRKAIAILMKITFEPKEAKVVLPSRRESCLSISSDIFIKKEENI